MDISREGEGKCAVGQAAEKDESAPVSEISQVSILSI